VCCWSRRLHHRRFKDFTSG